MKGPSFNFEGKDTKQKAFTELFEQTIRNRSAGVPFIEYNLPYPKEDFLKFLATEKNVLLHGSSNIGLEILEPRQANDSSKASGNKKAVYGVVDSVLPIFYAIQDRSKINGVVHSSAEVDLQTGESKYRFRMPKEALEAKPWINGVVYIFDRSQFSPEADDAGEPSGEWTSDVAIEPIARLKVSPNDFRFINEVEGSTT